MEPAIFSATSPLRALGIFGDFRWKCGAGPVGGVLRSRGGESLEPNKSAHKKDSAQNDRLWAGRFNQPQDMLFDRLNASLPYDRILAPYDIRGSKVHVGMLGSIGVLDGKEVDVLTSGLDQVLAEYETGAFPGEAGDEDIHMAVERRLTEIVGPVGGKVHTGRSRNDQVALDVQLYLRDATYGHARRALRLMRVLLGRAQADGEMIMPGYTHLQRAPSMPVGCVSKIELYIQRNLVIPAATGVHLPSNRPHYLSQTSFHRHMDVLVPRLAGKRSRLILRQNLVQTAGQHIYFFSIQHTDGSQHAHMHFGSPNIIRRQDAVIRQ